MKQIYLDVLIANALIELIEKKGENSVNYNTVIMYGIEVLKQFELLGKKAKLLISNNDFRKFVLRSKNTFTLKINNDKLIILLNEDKDLKFLKERYRKYINIEDIIVFSNPSSLKALGIDDYQRIRK